MLEAYHTLSKKSLSNPQKQSDSVTISLITELSLSDYSKARILYCKLYHESTCVNCARIVDFIQIITEEGYCLLRKAFNIVCPGIIYSPDKARRKLLQIPVVAIRIGDVNKGNSFTILTESMHGVNYVRIGALINGLIETTAYAQAHPMLEKNCVKMLLEMAQTDRERECMRYAIYKSSAMSATQCRRNYGFENITSRADRVEDAIRTVRDIRETIEEVANVQDKSIMATFGLSTENINSSDDSCDEEEAYETAIVTPFTEVTDICKCTLMKSNFNWFQSVEYVEENIDKGDEILSGVRMNLSLFGFTKSQQELVIQSYEAFKACRQDAYDDERTARAVNGDIVTESESDPNQYCEANHNTKLLITNQMKVNRRRLRRKRAKLIADQRFLSKKASCKVNKILTECPDIGTEMEKYVTSHNIGADAWRRTGVLTFDGNTKLKSKVTYEGIRQHLQQLYKRKFSYGSIVQLCVSRNKRRSSSSRYKGVAKITSRRARKGFTLKYNPDSHWSAALYKGLNQIQLKDNRDICLINRDDAAGFRLDTLTTCKQYATPSVQGKDLLTTRTDFVNKYTSVLQVTSYNFTATDTMTEICAGVVKAPSSVHPKNPCQHYIDLEQLEGKEELRGAFFNPETDELKSIDAVRVDGASDESPSHEEVRFYWTERHLLKNKKATIVTTRCSGSSYLNRVELQNGCLSKGHSKHFYSLHYQWFMLKRRWDN